MSRQLGLSTLLMIACACALHAQEQLPVDIDDPVYPLLEIAAIRGLVAPGSAVKPYSEREVRSRLDAARAAERLSPAERRILDRDGEALPERGRAGGIPGDRVGIKPPRRPFPGRGDRLLRHGRGRDPGQPVVHRAPTVSSLKASWTW